MVVLDMQLKFIIQRNIDIKCWFNAHTIDEPMWGINYILKEFVPEEKENITKKCSMSEQMEKKIKAYRFNIPSHMIGREFIPTVGHLYKLELFFETYSEILRANFATSIMGLRPYLS